MRELLAYAIFALIMFAVLDPKGFGGWSSNLYREVQSGWMEGKP